MKFYKKKKFFISLVAIIFSLILIFFCAILIQTALVSEPEYEMCESNKTSALILDNATLARFRKSLSFKTISLKNDEEFENIIAFIKTNFPHIHSSSSITKELMSNYTLLYKFEGLNAALKPYLLIGHLDVVPTKKSHWNHDPFASEIYDGYIYGRGTLDAKYIVMGILEALERILDANIPIQRGFYLVFGHDEETMGFQGAKKVAQLLENRNVNFEFILDEGTFVMPDLLPGLRDDVTPAIVCISEKGYLTLNISVKMQPAHSSLPANEISTIVLSRALSKLDGNSQPSVFGSGPEIKLFTTAAPYAKFWYKMIFSNLWLFSGILGKVLAKNPRSNALIRTSTAVTIIRTGQNQENIVPATSWAIVNFRVHPSDTNDLIIERVRNLIDDERVKITKTSSVEPPGVSKSDDSSFGFQIIKRAILQTHPKTVVMPGLLVASTDSKWFQNLSKSTYRFSPAIVMAKDLGGIHGNNERISLESYEKAIKFYYNLIIESNKSNLDC